MIIQGGLTGMRTKIEAGWIVGFQGDTHALFRDAVVVYEGTRILYVGTSFDGDVDRTIDARGKLLCPGFIDTHVHSGHRATHRLISDTGRGTDQNPVIYLYTCERLGPETRGARGRAVQRGEGAAAPAGYASAGEGG